MSSFSFHQSWSSTSIAPQWIILAHWTSLWGPLWRLWVQYFQIYSKVLSLKLLWLAEKVLRVFPILFKHRHCVIFSVVASLTIWKQTMSPLESIIFLYVILFNVFKVVVSPLSSVSSSSSARVYMVPFRRISHPFIPSLSVNLSNHIHHFYFSPSKRIILKLFSSVFLFTSQRDRSFCRYFEVC